MLSEESPAEWRITPLFHTSISDTTSFILEREEPEKFLGMKGSKLLKKKAATVGIDRWQKLSSNLLLFIAHKIVDRILRIYSNCLTN